MQASKIIPGKAYAVRRGEQLLRFQVHEVNTVTKRRGANRSPHDSRSEVVGHFVDGTDADTRAERKLSPDDIAGEFSEFAELVERKKQEDDAQKAKQKAANDQAKADRLLLYEFVGVTPPQKHDDYDQLFRVAWNKVDVREDGARKLAERVRNLKGHK